MADATNGTRARLEQAESIGHDHEVRLRVLERNQTEHMAWAKGAHEEQLKFNDRLAHSAEQNVEDHANIQKDMTDIKVKLGRLAAKVGGMIAVAGLILKLLG